MKWILKLCLMYVHSILKSNQSINQSIHPTPGFSDIPPNWRKVDLLREARSLQKTALNVSTVDILQSIFFLRRLKAMLEFFDAAILHSKLMAHPERANVAPQVSFKVWTAVYCLIIMHYK